MIPRTVFEKLRGEKIRFFVKDLPDPHCIQYGRIEDVTEHLVLIKDEDHDQLVYIPIEKIVLIKTT